MADMDGLLYWVPLWCKSQVLVLYLAGVNTIDYDLACVYEANCITYSTGVMQDFFNQTLFKDNEAALIDLSFVGTLSLICVNGFSPIVQVAVSRFGLRPVMILGTLFIVIALEMASLATEVIGTFNDLHLCT